MSSDEGPGPELGSRLGYLLKHAQLRMAELNAEALAPYGIDGRELGVLTVIAGAEAASQQEVAHRLGSDRTTMVALLDALERKGLVARRPHPHDRRRNVVELTNAGQETLRKGGEASVEAERRLLAALSPQAAKQLRKSLHALIFPAES